jgi:hypothetical protein
MRRLSPPSPSTAISLLALFVALGGTGYAVIKSSTVPDKNGVFHGCVNKSSGALRIVEQAGSCKKKTKRHAAELEVRWSEQGPKGATGAAGAAGKDGTNGAAGANGTTIVARPRSTGPVTTTSSPQGVPMTSATWAQAVGEVNQFVGSITFHAPAASNCTYQLTPGSFFVGSLTVSVKIDGTAIGGTFLQSADGADHTTTLSLAPLLEPASATNRTLSVEVSDNCGTNGGGASSERFRIDSVSVDVLSAR